jgi:hypothetical protein
VPGKEYRPPKVIVRGKKHLVRQRAQRIPPSLVGFHRRYGHTGLIPNGLVLALVKALHTLVFVAVFSAMLFLLYCGIANRLSQWTAVAFMLVFLEVTIYVGHGFKCPLKTLATRLTPSGQPVHDIYLPAWLSSRVIAISTPLLVVDFLLLVFRLLRE